MKTLKIAVLLLMMFLGYNLAEGTSLNTMKEYMAAWNVRGASWAVQSLADDTVYYDTVAGEPINDRERAGKEVAGASIKTAPSLSWKMVGKSIYDEDIMAFRWELSGRDSGEWVGSPPTNNPIKFEGVSYIHVEAGKVARRGDYYDSKKLDEELRLVK